MATPTSLTDRQTTTHKNLNKSALLQRGSICSIKDQLTKHNKGTRVDHCNPPVLKMCLLPSPSVCFPRLQGFCLSPPELHHRPETAAPSLTIAVGGGCLEGKDHVG